MYRRWMAAVLVVILGMTLALPRGTSAAASKGEALLGINDKLTEIAPLLKSGNYYVPVRELAKEMGLQMTGSPEHIVLADQSGRTLTLLRSGDQALRSDGAKVKASMFVSQGRTMIPFGTVAESFNYKVTYNPDQRVLRAVNNAKALSESEFLKKYSQQIAKLARVETPSSPGQKGKQPVYLTFDDGPSAHTGQLLDILSKYDAKATFFMLGNRISSYPAAVQRMVKEGHALGLHGMTHEKNKFYASPAAALKEMNQDNERLNKAVKQKTTLIRTPYGSKPYFTQSFRDKVLGEGGYHMWDWNVDSLDWKYKSNSRAIYNNVMKQVHNEHKHGTAPLILFHDQAATLKVLPQILAELKKEGYNFEILTSEMKPVNFWKDAR
ncbi:xylanase deacetylase [Paenibacillus sp. CAA11]|uniref:polysaccharide deacetylase n=1 Tax=Paenibacillus sp. CAA11 TaxID=1532905 RepID=UPI000D37564A|nr:polysaccharide deacetylase [Paenibacillus sp. CAA11]AWB43551.1 xylanase deacetylase [Paenibacillus sp. CAA11]